MAIFDFFFFFFVHQVEAKTGVKLPQMYNESNVNLLDVAIREKKKTQLWKAAPVSSRVNTFFTIIGYLT